MPGVISLKSGADLALASASQSGATFQALMQDREKHLWTMGQAKLRAQQQQAYVQGVSSVLEALDPAKQQSLLEQHSPESQSYGTGELLMRPGSLSTMRQQQAGQARQRAMQEVRLAIPHVPPELVDDFLKIAGDEIEKAELEQAKQHAVGRATRAFRSGLLNVTGGLAGQDDTQGDEEFNAQLAQQLEASIAAVQSGELSPLQLDQWIDQKLNEARGQKAEQEIRARTAEYALEIYNGVIGKEKGGWPKPADLRFAAGVEYLRQRVLTDEDFTVDDFWETMEQLEEQRNPTRRGTRSSSSRGAGAPEQTPWQQAIELARDSEEGLTMENVQRIHGVLMNDPANRPRLQLPPGTTPDQALEPFVQLMATGQFDQADALLEALFEDPNGKDANAFVARATAILNGEAEGAAQPPQRTAEENRDREARLGATGIPGAERATEDEAKQRELAQVAESTPQMVKASDVDLEQLGYSGNSIGAGPASFARAVAYAAEQGNDEALGDLLRYAEQRAKYFKEDRARFKRLARAIKEGRTSLAELSQLWVEGPGNTTISGVSLKKPEHYGRRMAKAYEREGGRE